jgi:hypothetical protein
MLQKFLKILKTEYYRSGTVQIKYKSSYFNVNIVKKCEPQPECEKSFGLKQGCMKLHDIGIKTSVNYVFITNIFCVLQALPERVCEKQLSHCQPGLGAVQGHCYGKDDS